MTSEAILGRNLYAIDTLGEKVEQVVRQLPLRGTDGTYLISDDALRTTTLTASAASKSLWRLACAARAEIVRRIAERVPDPAVLRREVAREAAEQGIAVRTLRDDARIGETFATLFCGPDSAPDIDKTYYKIALFAPDPKAALTLAMERKDADPLYSTSDFEAEIARARMADPAASYGPSSEGRCGLVFLWPLWDQGVMEETEKALALPLDRWLFPDSIILVRTPPRALDLSMRLLAAHHARYWTAFLIPRPPYRDGATWHEHEMVLCGTTGALRPPEGLPGTWRDAVVDCIDRSFPFAAPKLAVFPRRGMELREGWMTVNDLPSYVR